VSPVLRAACLARAIAVNDASFRQIVWRKFDVYAIARKNLDVMSPQTPGNVSQNDVAVVEFDGKGRAREDLLDAAVHLQRRFFRVLHGFHFGGAGVVVFFAVTNSYNECSFLNVSSVGGVARSFGGAAAGRL
jgi:hypothetical protein